MSRIASYQIRVHLSNGDEPGDEPPVRILKPLTVAEIEKLVADALYEKTNFYDNEVSVTAERLDK